MKTAFILSVSCCMLATQLFSQDAPKRQIHLGPLLGVNVAVSTVNYHVSGAERSPTPGSIFGVVSDFPLGPQTSVLASFAYYTLAFSDQNTDLDPDYANDRDFTLPKKMTTEGSFNYIALATMFKVSYFTIGFQFGLPISSAVTNSPSWPSVGIVEDITPADDERNILIEGIVGGDFPIIENNDGSFRLGFTAGYQFTEILKAHEGKLPKLDDNFRLPRLQLTLAYLFSL